MDENWFYTMVSRIKNKKITNLGVLPWYNTTHHKSQMRKVLVIAATGLIVNDNDTEAGGRGVHLSLSRAEKMARARKDSYKRVYAKDGTYSYPCIVANRIRRKGELCWKDCDITGSDPGTEKDPKYDLLTWQRDILIPSMESEARKLYGIEGKEAVFRYQINGAGPHQDKTLQNFIEGEFQKRG